MKTSSKIIIAVETVVLVLMFIYAFTQRLETDKQKRIAIENERKATESFLLAEEQRKIAEAQRARAEEIRMDLMQKLSECESKRK